MDCMSKEESRDQAKLLLHLGNTPRCQFSREVRSYARTTGAYIENFSKNTDRKFSKRIIIIRCFNNLFKRMVLIFIF